MHMLLHGVCAIAVVADAVYADTACSVDSYFCCSPAIKAL